MTSDASTTESPGKARTSKRRALLEQEIFEAAARLFAERGSAGTNLQDIADAVGLTRPALYHYVRSKEDLLARLVLDVTEGAAAEISELAGHAELSPTERVRAIVSHMVERQGRHPARFRLLIRSEADLPEELAETHRVGRRAVLQQVSSVIAEGVADGSFRAVDPRTAALAMIGMTNWVAWWFNAEHDDLEAVCADLAEQAVHGLLADPAVPQARTPTEALALVRADLDRVERLLES